MICPLQTAPPRRTLQNCAKDVGGRPRHYSLMRMRLTSTTSSFARCSATGEWHILEAKGHYRAPLPGSSIPNRRWLNPFALTQCPRRSTRSHRLELAKTGIVRLVTEHVPR